MSTRLKEEFSGVAKDMAKTFWQAMLETPRQMYSPWIAGGATVIREIKKIAAPKSDDKCHHPSGTK
ncbi:hypothetical protein ABC383_22605 [Noviherbaspirillum sp. 1P10PC]|uniref:hypothetical protein n=1 Tax=Noviherbaspirillum sp. 1P10PC TaxID=3132292 RepID=UPI0039A07069